MQHSWPASEANCFDAFANKRKFQSISDTHLRPQFYEKVFSIQSYFSGCNVHFTAVLFTTHKKDQLLFRFSHFPQFFRSFFNLASYINWIVYNTVWSFMAQIWWHVCCCAILRWSRQMTLEDKLCLWPAKNLEIYIQIILIQVIDTFHFLFYVS